MVRRGKAERVRWDRAATPSDAAVCHVVWDSSTCSSPPLRGWAQAITWLESQGVEGITGDCGFMMWCVPRVESLRILP